MNLKTLESIVLSEQEMLDIRGGLGNGISCGTNCGTNCGSNCGSNCGTECGSGCSGGTGNTGTLTPSTKGDINAPAT